MRKDVPRKSCRKTSQIQWHDAEKQVVIFQSSRAALRFLSQGKPQRLYSTGCSVWSAHGAQRRGGKVTVAYPQVSVKRCQRVSRKRHISNYPPFCPNVPFIVAGARFEIQHDAVVNHVCMSKQLCQAEAECPLLARLRPRELVRGCVVS